jgi:predicted dehydrogenase
MPRPGGAGGPDRLDLVRLDFPGDRVAQITLDRLTRGRHRYLTLRLDGTRGSIETEIGGALSVRAGLRARTRRPFLEVDFAQGGQARLYTGERFRKLASEPRNVFARATERLCAAFLEALERGAVPPCAIEDNRKSLALMRAAYDSAARGAVPVAP